MIVDLPSLDSLVGLSGDACQVAPEFPPQFAPESPPSRCDVRTGPMGSSPVSSLFSASLQ
jgi:hypothetical protein